MGIGKGCKSLGSVIHGILWLLRNSSEDNVGDGLEVWGRVEADGMREQLLAKYEYYEGIIQKMVLIASLQLNKKYTAKE